MQSLNKRSEACVFLAVGRITGRFLSRKGGILKVLGLIALRLGTIIFLSPSLERSGCLGLIIGSMTLAVLIKLAFPTQFSMLPRLPGMWSLKINTGMRRSDVLPTRSSSQPHIFVLSRRARYGHPYRCLFSVSFWESPADRTGSGSSMLTFLTDTPVVAMMTPVVESCSL